MAGLLGERVTQAPDQMQAIIISERNRILDYQNLVAGCKPIPDALKHLGWIVDDDPSHWHCEYLQVRVPRAKEQTLLILIEEG